MASSYLITKLRGGEDVTPAGHHSRLASLPSGITPIWHSLDPHTKPPPVKLPPSLMFCLFFPSPLTEGRQCLSAAYLCILANSLFDKYLII